MNLSRKVLAAVLALALPAVSAASELTNVESAKFKVKIGGFFYGMAHFDTNEGGSRPWLIVVDKKSNRGAFHVDPFGTRLNIGVESQIADSAVAKGFIEFDWGLNGTSTVGMFLPRLRHAYAAIEMANAVNILVGQFWLPNQVLVVDTFSPNNFLRQGNTWSRTPQLAVSKSFGPVKAALMLASTTGVTGSVSGVPSTLAGALVEHPLPAAFAQLTYNVMPKSWIAVTGGVAQPTVGFARAAGAPTDTVVPDASGFTSIYADAATQLAFGPLTVGGKVAYGVGAGLGLGVGQSLVIDAENKAQGIPALAASISAKYTILPTLSLAAYFGIDDPTDVVAERSLAIRSNRTVGGVLTWTAVEGGVLGLEVMNVSTLRNVGTGFSTVGDLRASLVARYSF